MTGRTQRFSDREIAALKAFLILGAVLGLLTVIYYSLGPFTGQQWYGKPLLASTIIVVTSVVQMTSAIAVTGGFAYLFIRWRVKRLLSFPLGALLGTVAGGLS